MAVTAVGTVFGRAAGGSSPTPDADGLTAQVPLTDTADVETDCLLFHRGPINRRQNPPSAYGSEKDRPKSDFLTNKSGIFLPR